MPSFVDANILVYAEDRDAGDRHEIARDLVIRLWGAREGVLSVQVLQELYVTLTRKVKRPLVAPRAREIVEEYLTWTAIDNTGGLILQAIALHQRARLSFWDALIVQAAIEAGSDRLYSEDLNAGQTFGRAAVVNPFAHRGGGASSP